MSALNKIFKVLNFEHANTPQIVQVEKTNEFLLSIIIERNTMIQ